MYENWHPNKLSVFDNKKVLIIGAAGSIGTLLTKGVLDSNAKQLRIMDIDETRLFELTKLHPTNMGKNRLVPMLGDIKDYERLKRAMKDIDIVINLAAMKHVVSSEYDPEFAIQVNVNGTLNVVKAAIENNVEKVVFTSSDKAADPNNLMGATKLVAEKIMNAAGWSKGDARTIFINTRFGNVMGSRGSVIPLWKSFLDRNKPIPITDPHMTRFMMTMEDAVRLIMVATQEGNDIYGGTYIFKMHTVKLSDLANVIINSHENGEIGFTVTGSLPGETDEEQLMTDNEYMFCKEFEDYYFVPSVLRIYEIKKEKGNICLNGNDNDTFSHVSKTLLTKEQLEKLLKKEGLI